MDSRPSNATPRHDGEQTLNTLAESRSPPPAQSTGAPQPVKTTQPTMRTATVVVYLALAALALIPGLMLTFGVPFGYRPADTALQGLGARLDDIRFGSGLRFWAGVTGASAMGLLLLYPLRKALAKGRGLGRISGWFHVHIVFGIFGPVLIAYHSNFGLGGSNANVALWAMIAVAVSGIIGHFIYASVSAAFYADKQQARAQLDAIANALTELNAQPAGRQQIIDSLAVFETELLTPRQGIAASIAARWRLEQRKRLLARALSQHVSDAADQLHLTDADHETVRTIIGRHFGAYVRTARQASSRSLREQIWARWRLFHLPAFIIMTVATVLHVAAVWNMDAPGQRASTSATPEGITLDTRRITTLPVVGQTSVAPPTPKPAVRRTAVATETDTVTEPPKLKLEPRPVPKRTEAAPVLAKPETTQPRPDRQIQSPPTPLTRPIAAAPPVPPAPAPDPIAELARRPEAAPMGLGGAKPRTLAEQIQFYKARLQAKTFAHSEAETGFALTGKHTKVECASCHQKPLTEQPSTAPRACIACHKADDIHRGRRPDCAQCHTANRWSEIIKRQ